MPAPRTFKTAPLLAFRGSLENDFMVRVEVARQVRLDFALLLLHVLVYGVGNYHILKGAAVSLHPLPIPVTAPPVILTQNCDIQ